MIGILLSGIIFICPAVKDPKDVSPAERQDFVKLLTTLETERKLFTQEGLSRVVSERHVLLALTAEDASGEGYAYLFIAVTTVLSQEEEIRTYVTEHFDEFAHPGLKLLWGVMLFEHNVRTPNIIRYLKQSVEAEESVSSLQLYMGGKFEDFRKRVLEAAAMNTQGTCPVHCFCCKKNLNNIDLLITLDYDFRSAVALLQRWLNDYEAGQVKSK